MIMNILKVLLLATAIMTLANDVEAQVTERERPAEWSKLVEGGRFRDRFMPMKGSRLSTACWGADGVRPRLVDNGIEDATWSYWGGNIMRADDGKFHLFVCGWLESSPKGHATWPKSQVFNAESDSLYGPYVIKDIIGNGHNPEIYRTKEGKYMIYVVHGRYVSDSINGPWTRQGLQQDNLGWNVRLDQSNETFAVREDSSVLMVTRGGEVFVSRTGMTPFVCVSDKSAFPKVEGKFEDPVVWRDHVQYNMIVNDWYGRIAYYLRSDDGVNWTCDPGEAYTPGIAYHEDGTHENWFKYERMKVYQDEYGRAVQANFAVIDTLKPQDKGRDSHSSKNICIPLNPGVLMDIVDNSVITPKTRRIRVRIKAEDGFNPQTDIDFNSLRFGASSEVNFGRGCKAIGIRSEGNDVIVTFDGKGNGMTKDEFALKLIGRYTGGKLLYGYARIPYMKKTKPLLTPHAPEFDDDKCRVAVDNIGQVASGKSAVTVMCVRDGRRMVVAKGEIAPLPAYGSTTVTMPLRIPLSNGVEETMTVTIDPNREFTIKKKIIK